MNTQQIKALQDSLVAQGFMTQAEVNTGYGIYGPKTTRAVAAHDSAAKAAEKVAAKTVYNTEVKSKEAANPKAAPIPSFEDAWTASGGDMSKLIGPSGKPFSSADQQSALDEGTAAVSPFYKAEQQYATQNTESDLKQKAADYQAYLDKQAAQFQVDKTTQDQTAANQGVLFSGGRAQKLQNLQDTYAKNASAERASTASSMGNTARDFQYKYGNDAASGLSSMYNLGSNSYNAGVAQGGATSNGLSSVYSPSTSNFQGTKINEAKAEAQKRAAGLLWNKGNKLVQGGYKNQY